MNYVKEPLIFELSKDGRAGNYFNSTIVDCKMPAQELLRDKIGFPSVSELQVVRHYTHLSSLNFGVDTGFYPLGSCTMKYNPKINEKLSILPGFSQTHPLAPVSMSQGCLQILFETEKMLSEITGMDAFSLQPA
ncbi:MAG: aminomethyl-transferring glycine dehydrogenase subunit GcvPB, partial [Pseudomonadota bacterium]